MNRPFARAAGIALLPITLAACSVPAPYMDAHIGQALSDMQKAQTLNPGADRNTTAPHGMAASTAKLTYEQYQKSFKAPEPRSSGFVIGLGR